MLRPLYFILIFFFFYIFSLIFLKFSFVFLLFFFYFLDDEEAYNCSHMTYHMTLCHFSYNCNCNMCYTSVTITYDFFILFLNQQFITLNTIVDYGIYNIDI